MLSAVPTLENGEVIQSNRGQNAVRPVRVRLEFLDGVRGFAALYVVFFHIWIVVNNVPGMPRPLLAAMTPLGFGHFAVGVFIVLSGFCLMLPVSRSKDGNLSKGVKGFIFRRARRILPPYYAALLCGAAWTFYLDYSALRQGSAAALRHDFSTGSLLTHLLLIQNLFPQWVDGFNSTHGFLATEWQIYFLFALGLLPLWRRFGMGAALTAGLAFGVFIHYAPPFRFHFDRTAPWFLGLFAMGMLGAEIVFSARREMERLREWPLWDALTAALALAFLAFTFCVKHSGVHFSDPVWLRDYAIPMDFTLGLAAMSFIVTCARHSLRQETRRPLILRALENPLALRLGRFSYSLYLLHLTVLSIVATALGHFVLSPVAYFALTWGLDIPLSLLLAYGFHCLAERPFMTK